MLEKVPIQIWALVLAFMGVVLAVIALFHPSEPTNSQAVFQIANGLVTGGLGAFAGHQLAGSNNKTDVTGNAPVTINQTGTPDPKQ